MRQIFLDTETTGLDSSLGHRVVEVAAVEVVNRKITGNYYQTYVNPQREIDEGARKVHGLDLDFLSEQRVFPEIIEELILFLSDTELIIHNAPFDLGFLNVEFNLCRLDTVEKYVKSVTDTLVLARNLHPGKRNSLDALCDRYYVDNSNRDLHGALLDSRLLAECYLAMTRGQESLLINNDSELKGEQNDFLDFKASRLILKKANNTELAEHENYLEKMKDFHQGGALWNHNDNEFE